LIAAFSWATTIIICDLIADLRENAFQVELVLDKRVPGKKKHIRKVGSKLGFNSADQQ